MVLLQSTNQMLLCDVCVSLGCRNRAMSQELLYHADIRPIAEEQCGDRVPEHVWSYAAFDTSVATQPCDHVGDSLRRQPSPGGVQKEGSCVGLDEDSGGEMLLLSKVFRQEYAICPGLRRRYSRFSNRLGSGVLPD